MAQARRLASIYRSVARTYRGWLRSLLLLALIVFLPLSLLDALTAQAEIRSLDFDSAVEIGAALGVVAMVSLSGLLGEIFYSGAVAVSLTHPDRGRAPKLREVARRLDFGRLLAVDVLYGLLVTIGLVLLVAPGVAAFVWLALAGPVVEIEGRGVRDAFARSWQLVRGRFWIVFAVLIPIELFGEAVAKLLGALFDGLLGDSFLAAWLAEALSSVAFVPIFAVALVLLTLDLIAEKDGRGPRLNPAEAHS